MQFKDVIGQDAIKNRFIQSVKDNRISHAQLFFGPEGCGKMALALAYAQWVSCVDRTETDSCGVCRSCHKYQKLIHPDLHFVFPVVRTDKFQQPISDNFLPQWRQMLIENPYIRLNSWLDIIGAENLQGNIYTHESAEILKKLSLKTFEAEYKTMIIWLPERMQDTAANKLLKILEEPPPKTLFILVTENYEQIITTILSRTQLLKIPKIDGESIRRTIQQKFELPEEEITNAVNIANGNYCKALDYIQSSNETQQYLDIFIKWVRMCFMFQALELVEWADSMAKQGRERNKRFLLYGLRIIHECLVLNTYKSTSNSMLTLTTNELEFTQKFSGFITENNIFHITNEFEKAHLHIERNVAPKFVFLDLSFKLTRLLKSAETTKR